MKYTFICLLALAVVSCSKSQEQQLSEIRDLEKSEDISTSEGLEKLAQLHEAYGLAYTDAEANSFLYAAGQYYFFEGNFDKAKDLLARYIIRDDSSERYRNAAVNLARSHAQDSSFSESDKLITTLLDKDLPTAAQWQDIITIYQDKIKSNSDVQVTDYERLTMAYTAVGRFQDAINSLDRAVTDFPNYEKRSNLLYRAGFIGWEYLNDTEVASTYYNQFLTEFPNDPKAIEVKQILESGMLTMSNEDILEMLKGKGK